MTSAPGRRLLSGPAPLLEAKRQSQQARPVGRYRQLTSTLRSSLVTMSRRGLGATVKTPPGS